MSTYLGLPPISLTATADTTGQNSGNYSNYFSSSVLGALNMPYVEWYHATVQNVPGGASATIRRNGTYTWGATAPGIGGVSEYAPANGMPLNPGDEIMFLWSTGSGAKPLVTLWFRYDLDIPANRSTAMGLPPPGGAS